MLAAMPLPAFARQGRKPLRFLHTLCGDTAVLCSSYPLFIKRPPPHCGGGRFIASDEKPRRRYAAARSKAAPLRSGTTASAARKTSLPSPAWRRMRGTRAPLTGTANSPAAPKRRSASPPPRRRKRPAHGGATPLPFQGVRRGCPKRGAAHACGNAPARLCAARAKAPPFSAYPLRRYRRIVFILSSFYKAPSPALRRRAFYCCRSAFF